MRIAEWKTRMKSFYTGNNPPLFASKDMAGNAFSGEDLKTDYPEITLLIFLLVLRVLR